MKTQILSVLVGLSSSSAAFAGPSVSVGPQQDPWVYSQEVAADVGRRFRDLQRNAERVFQRTNSPLQPEDVRRSKSFSSEL